jgi:hypothetical protein
MSSEPAAARGDADEPACACDRGRAADAILGVSPATRAARLWRDQRKRQRARELLGAIYGSFTEGFDTLDLKHAKAVLAEQAS